MVGFLKDKTKLDDEFLMFLKMDIENLRDLADGFEAVKYKAISDLHDCIEKLEQIYERIRLTS